MSVQDVDLVPVVHLYERTDGRKNEIDMGALDIVEDVERPLGRRGNGDFLDRLDHLHRLHRLHLLDRLHLSAKLRKERRETVSGRDLPRGRQSHREGRDEERTSPKPGRARTLDD